MSVIKALIAVLFGIVEGITEWLPISSTGHMILLNEFLTLEGDSISAEFVKMFMVVIQFGAILAVVLIFWNKLWPFCMDKSRHFIKKDSWALWFRIFVSCIPFGILGFLFEDTIDEMLGSYIVVAVALIFYGVIFIVLEKGHIKTKEKVSSLKQITYPLAFFIGCIQVLAMIPGTSRSGVSIIGAMLLGCSRSVATEYSFFLAVPAMAGSSLIKILKFGFDYSGTELMVLALGMLTAFAVSFFAVRFLVAFVKKHNFVVFGWYRIVLGILVLLYFSLSGMGVI